VLSTPPAFVLSQDQTLREELLVCTSTKSVAMPIAGAHVHEGATRTSDGVNSGVAVTPPRWRDGRRLRTWTHTTAGPFRPVGAHAVEFSKTAVPLGGDSSTGHARAMQLSVRARKYSACAQAGEARFLCPGLSFRRTPWPSGDDSDAHYQDTTCTSTSRRRGRSSKSISTSCCQVPSASAPSTTGTLSDGPISAARRCACAFVSALRRLCS
jgi:hypothetical protein